MNISFFERLFVVFELCISSPFLVCLFLLFCGLSVILFLKIYRSQKIYTYLIPIVCVVCFLFILICYFPAIQESFNYAIDDIFLKVYFPSITFYFAILITSIIALIISLVSSKISKVSKTIHIIFFIVNQFLFCVFLSILSTENFDVASWSDLYQTKEMLSVLETSTFTFVLWGLSLSICYVLAKIKEKVEPKEEKVYIEEETYQKQVAEFQEKIAKLEESLSRTVIDDEKVKQEFSILENRCENLEKLLQRKDQYYMEQINQLKQNDVDTKVESWIHKIEQFVIDKAGETDQKIAKLEKDVLVNVPEMKEKLTELNQLLGSFQTELEPYEDSKDNDVEIIDFDEETFD